MANNSVFITNKEADFLASYFQDAPLGTVRWGIYDRCRKTWAPSVWRSTHLSLPEDIYITTEQADIVAAELADAPFNTVENNLYEKCRRPCHDKYGKRIPAFIDMQWR